MTTVRVTQVRSNIGQSFRHEGTLRALGLGRIGKSAGIASVVFDRGGFKYHGRVAAVADGARSAGLEF